MKVDKTHWFIIANPAAGKGKVRKRLPQIKKEWQETKLSGKLVETTHRGHAIELAQMAIEQGYRKILAVGGDGTGNEVINGIFNQNQISTSEITYCLLPIGTGNDWVKTHQISKKLSDFWSMMKKEKTIIHDIGQVDYQKAGQREKRFFINVAGLADDAYVVQKTEQSRKTPYLWLTLTSLFSYRLPKARILYDQQTVEDYFYTINAGICRYSGGGMRIVPHAKPDDGQLALTFARQLSKWGVISNSYRFYNGTIGDHPQVSCVQVQKIRVEAIQEPIGVEVDGEYLGETPVDISILPAVLRVLVP